MAGGRLASQPTISRFENDAGRSALYRMGRELAASVIERHRRRLRGRARRITIDLDPTDDRTHGAQQLTFFNSHYDSWCYLPLLAFVRFDREVEQYLCAAVLRPGNAVAADGTLGVLSRLLPLLRCAFPRARFLVRLDGGFATPEIFDFLDAEPRLDYVVAMAKNAVLLRHAASAMVEARAKSAQDDETAHVYTDTRCYRAGTWDHERRVVWGAPSLLGHGLRENPMSPGGGGMVRSRQVKGAGSAPTEGARRATGVGADAAAMGSGALAPGQRWSASRKRDVVLRLLRSEPLDAVSREVGVEVYRLERWKVRALAGLELGLKEQAGEPLAAELDAAKRHIGELSMDNELLRSRARAAERRLPLATRRSRR